MKDTSHRHPKEIAVNSLFSARTPAKGVVVLGSMSSKANGLGVTQSKNCKLDDKSISWHVLKPTKRCEPMGLGLPSTVKTVPHHVLSIPGCAPQTVRPGSRRRGHKHMPKNMGFSAKSVT